MREYCIGMGSFDPAGAVAFSEGYRWNPSINDWQGFHGAFSDKVSMLVYSKGRWYELLQNAPLIGGSRRDRVCRLVGCDKAAAFLADAGYAPSEVLARGVPLSRVKELLLWYVWALTPTDRYSRVSKELLAEHQLEAVTKITNLCSPSPASVLCSDVPIKELAEAISAAHRLGVYEGRDATVIADVLAFLERI